MINLYIDEITYTGTEMLYAVPVYILVGKEKAMFRDKE